jgi:hypothetical protein
MVEEESFLEEVERASFLFFWEQANPSTGLIKDRSLANGRDARTIAVLLQPGLAFQHYASLIIAVGEGRENQGAGASHATIFCKNCYSRTRFLLSLHGHEHGCTGVSV